MNDELRTELEAPRSPMDGECGSSFAQIRRALATLRASNRALALARDEHEWLRAVCAIAVREGGYRFAWIGYAPPAPEQRVRPVASAGYEHGYLERIRVHWSDDVLGRGPVGRAIREGRVQVIRDIASDPGFTPWRDEALRRGYQACIALPLSDGEHIFGALAVYSDDAFAFDREEAQLLREEAGDLAFGIRTLRVRAQRDRLQAIVEHAPDFISTATPDGRLTYLNAAALAALGSSEAALRGEPLTRLHPTWAQRLITEEGIPHAIGAGPWQGETALLAADGSEIPVSQLILAHRGNDNEVAWLSTVMRDLRPHKRQEARLRASEEVYRRIMHAAREGFRLLTEHLDQPGDAPALNRLPVYRGNEILLVDVDRICHLRADGHYTRVATIDATHLSDRPLSHLERQLDTRRFLRVHRSYLVNTDCVEAVANDDGQLSLVMKTAGRDRVPVSRRNAPLVRERLGL